MKLGRLFFVHHKADFEDNFMYGMNKSELRLLPHDSAWKDDFLAEKIRIEEILNDPSAKIEHVGSTAIPTVHAKPILDIAILCGEQGIEPVAQALTSLGYDYRRHYDESETGHYYAVLDRDNVRFCQAHIFTESNDDWHLKLRFRDVLRQNAELAREYDDYKRQLAQTVANKSEYAEIKTRWVDTFIEKVKKA